MAEWWAITLALLSALCGGTAPIIIKIGTKKSFKKIADVIFNMPIIAGLALYGLGAIFFIPALKGGELSVLYPFIATSYIWATILSKKVLDEDITRNKWYGIIFIVIGIILIGKGI